MSELIIAGKCQLDGNAEAFDRHDGHATNCAADGDVDERILATVGRSDAVDHYDGEDGDGGAIEEEEGLYRVIEHLVDCFNRLIWRSV